MGERSIELNVISAKDLKKVKKIGNQTCYAVAYVSSSDKKATWLDSRGGVNPTWDAKLTLACEDGLLHKAETYITVEIYSHGYFSNTLVGTSKIWLSQIDKQAKAPFHPKRFSFLVRRPSGAVKGVLNVAVKIGELRNISSLTSDNFKPKVQNGADRGSVNPPLWPSTAISMSGPKKKSEPMSAYPNSASLPAHVAYRDQPHHGTLHDGLKKQSDSRPAPFYPSTQSSGSHKHQKVYYSKPRRTCGSTSCKSRRCSSRGMGLFPGVLEGQLLGDVLL